MMNFRKIKDSIVKNILLPAAAGRFTVGDAATQTRSADEHGSAITSVQVYYSIGDFPKSGRFTGPTTHEITFKVEMTVARTAVGDILAITGQSSTSDDIAAALASFQAASNVADDAFDSLFEIVYQILMDGRNIDMGLPVGTVSSRWVGNVKKDNPVGRGNMLVLTGSMDLTLKTVEQITGDTGVLIQDGINTTILPTADISAGQ
jgi:hypothetical protein